MRSANCTDTISPAGGRPPVAYVIALAWFAGRQVAYWFGGSADRALLWAERARQRRQLTELDDYMLRDLGLSRADVASESSKPFWQQ